MQNSKKYGIVASALIVLLVCTNRSNATFFQFQQNVINGVTPTGSFNTEDTDIRSGSPTTNFDNNFAMNATAVFSGLMRFNVSAIPTSNAPYIQNATLRMTSNFGGTSTNTLSYDIYAMPAGNTAWTETTATYNNQNQTGPIAWIGGANAQAAALGSTLISSFSGSLTGSTNTQVLFPLNAAGVALVQQWINNPSSNAGFMIFATTTSPNSGFYTSDDAASFRPNFTVNAVPEPGSLALAVFGSIGVLRMARRRRAL